jgi:hypothetical protein
MKLSRSLLGVHEEASGSLELARWLLKPPKPLVMQIQEPKMKVVALVEHSAGEVEACHQILRWMLDEHPYQERQLSVFYRHAHRGIPPTW